MSSRLPMCLSLLLGLVSCRGGAPSADHDRAAGTPTSPRPAAQALAATEPPKTPAVGSPADGRSARRGSPHGTTQQDLARELAATDAAPDPDAALAELRARWQGRTLTWTVTRQQVLCRTAEACHVLPFATPAPKDAPRVGWLPALSFAPGQFDKLTAACGDAALCTVTFEGVLSELVASSELPTSLAFTGVAVVTANASS